MANRMSKEKRLQILHLLIEGNSVRSVTRLVGTNIPTVLRHLGLAGEHCRKIMDRKMRELELDHIQADEIWTFCRKKQGKLTEAEKDNPMIGDQYLYIALDTKTKLIPCYALGKRNEEVTRTFIRDLAGRIVVPDSPNVDWDDKPMLSTDGWGPYAGSIWDAFGSRVQLGQIIKSYENHEQPGRYGPPDVVKTERRRVTGIRNLMTICTSHVERNNLTIRTFMKRFTRLALGFSKKRDNLWAAISLHVAHYNFCRIHGSLGMTPSLKANVTDHLWSLEELLDYSY